MNILAALKMPQNNRRPLLTLAICAHWDLLFNSSDTCQVVENKTENSDSKWYFEFSIFYFDIFNNV